MWIYTPIFSHMTGLQITWNSEQEDYKVTHQNSWYIALLPFTSGDEFLRSKPVFKSDGNLDFNMGKTEFLTKGPTDRHVFERTQYFLQTDPDLQVIANDFTPEMFTSTGIEVLGTPIGTDD